jgi:hypothetical protein
VLAAVAEPVEPHFLWRPRLRDADDDMVLEAAVNGRPQAIATFNARDFAGVGKAITEIQPCRMSAALAEIPSGTRESCLNFGDRFDEDSRRSEQVIKATAHDWVAAAIDDRRGFNKINGSNRLFFRRSPAGVRCRQ